MYLWHRVPGAIRGVVTEVHTMEPTMPHGFDAAEIILAAKSVWNNMRSDPRFGTRFDGRDGGYVCVATQDGKPIVTFSVGEVHAEKWPRHFRNAPEKAMRLGKHPEHDTSRQSANEAAEQYPGAVRGTNYLWSVSFLLPDDDEVFSALLAIELADLAPAAAEAMLPHVAHLLSSET